MKLPKEFYNRTDVVQISRELLGKYLYSNIDGILTGGMIVETEAYSGRNDKACHAHLERRTKRTEIMYQEGGHVYVYLIYGIYSLFNIVTNREGLADAILIRAIEPTEGLKEMQLRRNLPKVQPNLTAGPGLLTQALGISTKHYGEDLAGDLIWVEDCGMQVPEEEILESPRVGIAYAEEHALLPWRFRVKGNPWTSKAK